MSRTRVAAGDLWSLADPGDTDLVIDDASMRDNSADIEVATFESVDPMGHLEGSRIVAWRIYGDPDADWYLVGPDILELIEIVPARSYRS